MYHYVPLCTTLYHYVPLCTTMYHYVPLCTIMYHYVPLCTTIYHYVPLCTIMYHYVPLRTIMYHYVPLCTTTHYSVPPCTTTYHSVPPCTTTYHYVPLCTTTYYSVPLCTTTYHSVPLCTTTYHYVPLCTNTPFYFAVCTQTATDPTSSWKCSRSELLWPWHWPILHPNMSLFQSHKLFCLNTVVYWPTQIQYCMSHCRTTTLRYIDTCDIRRYVYTRHVHRTRVTIFQSKPVPVAARSKASVYGRSLAGIVGSNPTEGMDVSLLWALCIVRYRSLWRADHSSRGVLPTVARRCVWSRNLGNEEALAHWGPQPQKKILKNCIKSKE